ELTVRGTRVSAKGIADLKNAFPKIQVPWTEPNRDAAEAVLALGGSVDVHPEGGNECLVRAAADLPAEYFRVTRVRVRGTGKPLGDLALKLSALTDPTFDDLQVLDLSGTATTNDDLLNHLGKLTKLTKLSLARTKVTAASLTNLKSLPAL